MPVRSDRRRRVLADDLMNSVASEPGTLGTQPLPASSGRRYALAAFHEHQPRPIDYIPQRAVPLLLFLAAGITAIAGLLATYAWLPELSAFTPASALDAFDLAQEHHLATWLLSLLLLVQAQSAGLIYGIRKHRVDDYHGRYRIWLGVALLSIIASLQLTAPMHRALDALVRPAALACGAPGEYGLRTLCGVVLSYVCVRTLFEVRRSRLTLFAYLLAIATLGYAQLPATLIWTFADTRQALLLKTGLTLSGCLLAVMAGFLYVRHLMLDVEGKILHREKKKSKPTKPKAPRRSAKADTEADDSKKFVDPPQKPKPHTPVRTDLDAPPARTAPLAKRVAETKPVLATPNIDADDEDDESEDDIDLRNMSRADRKKLKRQAKLAKRAQAA